MDYTFAFLLYFISDRAIFNHTQKGCNEHLELGLFLTPTAQSLGSAPRYEAQFHLEISTFSAGEFAGSDMARSVHHASPNLVLGGPTRWQSGTAHTDVGRGKIGVF